MLETSIDFFCRFLPLIVLEGVILYEKRIFLEALNVIFTCTFNIGRIMCVIVLSVK